MQKIFVITGAALLCAMTAGATDYAQYEVFAGYNWVRFNPNSPFVPSFNANGGNGQFVYNFNRWFGGEFDGGAVTKGTLNHFNVDTTVVNFVAGPRVTFGHQGRFRPFVHVLFGGAYNTASAQFSTNIPVNPIFPPGFTPNPNAPITTRLVASNTNFAMMAGGGLDWKWTKHVYFRPIGADYYLTRVPNNIWGNGSTTNRNNFRYSAGINFVWGEPK
jgi:hypothetical protein